MADGREHCFINLSVDGAGQRLFAADADQGELRVIDTRSGQTLRQVPIGPGTLDVLYNLARQEVDVTHRGVSRAQPGGRGGLTVIDAATYAVKRRLDQPVHPNSQALSPDGRALFVTVKVPHGDEHPAFRADAPDSVVRIALDR